MLVASVPEVGSLPRLAIPMLAGGMKTTMLWVLLPAVLWAGCSTGAKVRVTQTQVATGAVHPEAIYIRPFRIAGAPFDRCEPGGNTPIRKSLAPREFANDLQEQLSKLAPARVLEADELAPTGWVVEGEFVAVESGYAPEPWTPMGSSVSRPSCLKLHVRVRDVSQTCGEHLAKGRIVGGPVVYEFDVTAGTRAGSFGSVYAPGMGYPLPFDRRNAAELIALTLTPDPFKYGVRSSPVFRY